MLSFVDNGGRAIAVVKGGKNDREIIYVNENGRGNKFYNAQGGKLRPIPNPLTREVVYVAGPSGSGKSTYAATYIANYKKIYPENDVYVFSRLVEDEVIDIQGVNRIPIDESLITDPIDVSKELIDGALVLFDDIDTIQDDKLKKAIMKIQNDILEIGRHNNIYIISTSHLINGNDKKASRTMLNEAHSITVFPKSGSAYGIKYVLKNYIGFSNKQIEDVLKLPSRWVTVGKQYPQYVFYEGGAYIIE